jgi:2-dehydro-3-deoxygalactonokinase
MSGPVGPAVLIALDWGTTALRAYLMDRGGAILDRRDTQRGIQSVRDGDFAGVLEGIVAGWAVPSSPRPLPVVAAGMIGSRQGWREVPYLSCPSDAGDIAAALAVAGEGRAVHIVPGLSTTDRAGVPDVMRGEEAQIVGVLSDTGRDSGLFVLPGSHSKWVGCRGGAIHRFATYMTGEVFAVVRVHTILGRTMQEAPHDAAAFARGVDYGLAADGEVGGLLHRLFSARTLALFGELPAEAGASYLSGVLIGTEVREARAALPTGIAGAGEVTIIGRSDLTDLYETALRRAGVSVVRASADAAATGIWRIAGLAGLLEE